ncbi:hypothetical protein M3J09_012295 [Ascochyta lentis]
MASALRPSFMSGAKQAFPRFLWGTSPCVQQTTIHCHSLPLSSLLHAMPVFLMLSISASILSCSNAEHMATRRSPVVAAVTRAHCGGPRPHDETCALLL